MNIVIVILLIIAIVAVAVVLLAAVTVLVVWGASGLGWMLIHWLRLPFSAFEATLVSLVTFAIVTYSALRLLVALTTAPFPSLGTRSEEDEDEWEDEEDEDEWDEDEDEDDEQRPTPDLIAPIPSIPKWRQPIRSVPRVAPDDRCPCGSGRKYKNCHGRKS